MLLETLSISQQLWCQGWDARVELAQWRWYSGWQEIEDHRWWSIMETWSYFETGGLWGGWKASCWHSEKANKNLRGGNSEAECQCRPINNLHPDRLLIPVSAPTAKSLFVLVISLHQVPAVAAETEQWYRWSGLCIPWSLLGERNIDHEISISLISQFRGKKVHFLQTCLFLTPIL